MSVIKKIREQLSYTQQELAKKTGLSLRTIQRLESSNKEPKGHTLIVLAEVFKMDTIILQTQYKKIEHSKKDEATSIRLINLSVLSFLGIPFGNIIIPLIIWRKNRQSELVDEIGKRIVNFQILFSTTLSILLVLSPFISRKLFYNTPIFLFVLFAAYVFNIIIVFNIAMKLKRNNYNFLNIPIRLI
jgi:transcriptional regulator with XRE-family HTH domain